jgi:hypothetical protein
MSYERDYTPSDADSTKSLRDKLARIACKAMTELERIDPTNDLFKDSESGPWFTQHKIDDAKADAARRAKSEAKSKREAALAKLTAEDKKILNLR